MKKFLTSVLAIFMMSNLIAQEYFLSAYEPYDQSIPSPEAFLGYSIGDYHSRHDRILDYLERLDELSDRAELVEYGRTHELRRLVILQISDVANIDNLESLRQRHVAMTDPEMTFSEGTHSDLPAFVNLGYSVHGNEASSSEAALLTSYILVASQHPLIERLRQNAVVFIDPCINPDGRERHTQWVNTYRSEILSPDPMDAEHNETWPRGRTNHYWFDLNRDWLLAVHPESQGKLNWYHQWYPNVVTDFHEMGSRSTYFFEPMRENGSLLPIMPKENYTMLNDTFAKYYQREMDKIGSLYFTKEAFDGTYPGYGSSYPDIQGALGILFEQASSRGHIQDVPLGKITFPFTIRNQLVNGIATVEAAVDHKDLLHWYKQHFFKSALSNAQSDPVNCYVFGDNYDQSRLKAFLHLLLRHNIEVYALTDNVILNDYEFNAGHAYIVPTGQGQYRMVQTIFETYDQYKDSVFYDASAWSLANAYNMKYAPSERSIQMGNRINVEDLHVEQHIASPSGYAYVVPSEDYHIHSLIYDLQSNNVRVMVAQKPFSLSVNGESREFSYGSLVIPVQAQDVNDEELYEFVRAAASKWNIDFYSTPTGFSTSGIDLGSGYIDVIQKPKAAMLIGDGTSGYETGFVWHLLDQRVKMPITKIKTSQFGRADLEKYTVLVLCSGSYSTIDSTDIKRIREWVARGKTLITIGRGSQWAIDKKLVKEALVKKGETKNDTTTIERIPYDQAREHRGKDEVGGAIFEIELDRSHPVAYGYSDDKIPAYRNNTVWLQPSKNEFSNVAVYSSDPHIDGFITDELLDEYLKKSSPVIVSRIGSGRVVMFASDPNFRGTWYGTNKLFLNALFYGELIRIP